MSTKHPNSNSNARNWQTRRVDFVQGRTLLRALVLGLLAALLLGLLIYILPYSPDRTPMFVIAETGYDTPWPVNGWANEDVAALRNLHGALVDVHQIESMNGDSKSVLDSLRQRVNDEQQAIRSVGATMLYINCICAVNRNNEPCIVLNRQSPAHPESWLALAQLLEIFRELPEETQKVIFIDGVRYVQNWDLAEPLNPFVERVEALVSDTTIENLSIVTSSASGQISPSKNGFANALTKAIAGTRPGKDQFVSGPVSFANLLERLDQWVSDFAKKTEERVQNISVFTNAKSKDWVASVGMSSDKWKEISLQLAEGGSSNLNAVELDALWQRYYALPKNLLANLNPGKLHQLERELTRLEELAKSGPSLKDRAQAKYKSVYEELDELNQLDPSSPQSYFAAMEADQDYFFSTLTPHSLWLANYFGLLAEAQVDSYVKDAASFSFDSIPEAIELGKGKQVPRSSFEEVQVAQVLKYEGAEKLWGGSDPVRSALEQIHETSRCSVPKMKGQSPSLRSYSMCQPELHEMQETTRQLVDQLLIGPSRADRKKELASLLLRQKEAFDNKYETLHLAWQTADQVNRIRWHYLRWLAHPSRAIDAPECDFDLEDAKAQCVNLFDDSRRINAGLRPMEGEPLLSPSELDSLRRNLDTTLDNLKSVLDTYAKDLAENSSVNGYLLREVVALQSLPNLEASSRSALREKEADLRDKIFALKIPNADESLPQGPRERVLRLADLSDWGVQLASQSLPDAGTADNETAIRKIQVFRESLLNQKIAFAHDAHSSKDGNSLSKFWERSVSVRRSGSLWHEELDENPHRQLHFVLLQNMLHSLALKSVLDCFGSPFEESARKEHLFASTVRDYNEASNNLQNSNADSPVGFSKTLDQARQQELYLEGGVGMAAADESLIPGVSPLKIEATLSPRPRGRLAASGEAALFLSDAKGEKRQLLSEIRSENEVASSSFALPLQTPQNMHYALRSAEVLPSGQYDFLGLFRGHRLRTSLAVLGGTGYKYQWEPSLSQDATVTVYGDNQATPSVLFVLDCSESMASPVQGELGRSSAESKLDIAVGSLLRMLRELAESGRQTRVGVILLGHRMGWSSDAPLQLLTQPKLADTTPDTLTPSQDVELVLSLGRFDASSYSQLVEYMNSVEAWGQSPLYLGVRTALEEIAGKAPPSASAIVMITDGLNYQFTPASRAQSSEPPIGEEQIVNEIKESRVPVHILGFSIAESDIAAAEKTYKELSDASEGSFQLVNDEVGLLEILRKQLGTSTFRVMKSASEGAQNDLKGNLNQPAKVRLLSKVAEPWTVGFEDATTDVVIEGGEALQMRYIPSLGRFEPIPFDINFPTSTELTPPPSAKFSNLIARAHRPLFTEQAAVFSVSLQSLATPFTPRPQECFVQVEPLSKDGVSLGAPLFYFDCNWAPGTAVPMLKWTANGWPRDAARARVRLWCKFAKTPATVALGLDEFYQPGTLSEPRELPGIPGTRFSINVQEDVAQGFLTVAVTEIHDDKGAQIVPVKVMPSGNIIAQATFRYFDSTHGVASHVFRFKLDAKADLLRSTQIEFTPKSSLEEDAYYTETGIETDLVLGEELLPFDAGEGPFEEQLPPPDTDLQLTPSGS